MAALLGGLSKQLATTMCCGVSELWQSSTESNIQLESATTMEALPRAARRNTMAATKPTQTVGTRLLVPPTLWSPRSAFPLELSAITNGSKVASSWGEESVKPL